MKINKYLCGVNFDICNVEYIRLSSNMKHSDPKKELNLSPFRIYALIREETKHLVHLYDELNADPNFTFGVFQIVVINTSIANYELGIHNSLFSEWINVKGDPNFRGRDVIYRFYGNEFTFGSNHFMNANNPDIVRNAMYQISKDLINRIKNGIVEDIKHYNGVLDSLARDDRQIFLLLFHLSSRLSSKITLDFDELKEIENKITNTIYSIEVIDILENYFGKDVWIPLAELLERTNKNVRDSDNALTAFLSTGGMTSFPKITLSKSAKTEISNTHARYSIFVDGLSYPITGTQVKFEHTNSFAVYVWLLLQARETWVYKMKEEIEKTSKRFKRALIRTLFGEHFDDEEKLVNLMSERQTGEDGKRSFQSLQQAMSNANRDIINCFMSPKPKGRPSKERILSQEEEWRNAEREYVEKKCNVILIQNKSGRGNGRFIIVPKQNIEVCAEFYLEFLSHLYKDGIDSKFIHLYLPTLKETEEWKQYVALKGYICKGTKPSVLNLAVFDYSIEKVKQYINKYETEIFEKACNNRKFLVHCINNGSEKIIHELNRKMDINFSSREEIREYLYSHESEINGPEGIEYRACCRVAELSIRNILK